MEGKIVHISPDRRYLFIQPKGKKEKIYGHKKGCTTPIDLLEVNHVVFFEMAVFKGRSLATKIDTLPPVILPEVIGTAVETLANLETEAPASAAATFVPFGPTRDCAQAPAAGIPACAKKILTEPDA